MLTRLIYGSKTTTAMEYRTLCSINENSARRNAAIGVTGLLIYAASSFLQVLEGGRKAVNDTYRRIADDTRHNSPMILQVLAVSQRHFQLWAMKVIVLDPVRFPHTASVLHRFGATELFDPFDYSAESALQVLRAFSDQPCVN